MPRRFPRHLALLALLGALTLPSAAEAQGKMKRTPTRRPVAALGARAANPKGPFAANAVAHAVAHHDSLVALSRSLLGVRYVWAGESTKGVDCSGLVRYVFGRFGIDLPHSAAMLAERGTSVPSDTATMQPGDLIVFSKPKSSRISHVGIYTGRGMMLHASSVKKQVVEVPLIGHRGLTLRDVRRVVQAPAIATPPLPSGNP